MCGLLRQKHHMVVPHETVRVLLRQIDPVAVLNRNSAPSYATVTRWVAGFKRGRTSFEDDRRAGRPIEATTDDCCCAIETLVDGQSIKFTETAREVGISYGSVLNILHEHMRLSNVCSRWVPCLLTPVEKSFRVETCSELWLFFLPTQTTL